MSLAFHPLVPLLGIYYKEIFPSIEQGISTVIKTKEKKNENFSWGTVE